MKKPKKYFLVTKEQFKYYESILLPNEKFSSPLLNEDNLIFRGSAMVFVEIDGEKIDLRNCGNNIDEWVDVDLSKAPPLELISQEEIYNDMIKRNII